MPPTPKTITVPDTPYGSVVEATVSSVHGDGDDTYVFVQCYQGDDYVFAAYYPVVDGKASCGPLSSFLWPSGAAQGVATEGWFPAKGFGSWKELASTTFQVTEA